MSTLNVIYVTLLIVIAFRILLFTRFGARKPVISWLAYSLMIAAFVQVIMVATGVFEAVSFSEVVITAALALALLAHGGNLAHLFKASEQSPWPLRWLSYTPKKKAPKNQRPSSVTRNRRHTDNKPSAKVKQ